MTTLAGDIGGYPVRYAKRGLRVIHLEALSAAAAPFTSQKSDDPLFVITRTGVGTYTITYPQCLRAFFTFPAIFDADGTGTVVTLQTTSEAPTAGTATLISRSAVNTAADLAAGDKLRITAELFAEEDLV